MSGLMLILALQFAATSVERPIGAPVTLAVVDHIGQPGVTGLILTRKEGRDIIVVLASATANEVDEAVRAYRDVLRNDGESGPSRRIEITSGVRPLRQSGVGAKARATELIKKMNRTAIVPGVGRARVMTIWIPLDPPHKG